MTNDCRLTTFDNPFDPFEQFTQWFLFDVEKGYNTCSILGRIEQITDDMSEKESDEEHERAIDGDESILFVEPTIRTKNDTCPWRHD